jgi:hypothetical protein
MKYPRRIENLIANFRSIPEDNHQSTIRHAYRADALMEVVLERYRIGQTRPEELIMRNWKGIMGESMASRCVPRRLDRGRRLVITVPTPLVKQELAFQKSMLLNRIRRLKGCEKVQEIVFQVG